VQRSLAAAAGTALRPLAVAFQQVPVLFTRSGLLHPLVALFPAMLVAVVAAGPMQLIAAWLSVILIGLAIHHRRHIVPLTVSVALVAALVTGLLLLGPGDTHHPVLYPGFANTGGLIPGAAGVEAPRPEPPQLPPRLPELHSISVLSATLDTSPMDDPPVAVDDGGAATHDLRDVEHAPALRDSLAAAALLAEVYLRESPPPGRQRAVLRLRIGTDGRATPDDIGLISSTAPAAATAALLAGRYLDYAPALLYGRPVAVWVSQPLVFEP
jgi:hypothetical protein